MIGNLIRAELRKVFSVNMWWGLLIPVALVSLLFNLANTAVATFPGTSTTGPVRDTSLQMLGGLAESTAITSIFAVVLGCMAVTGEFRHRTITTTFLTAGRGASLGAKLIAYAGVGGIYGLAGLLAGLLGAVIASGGEPLPGPAAVLAVGGLGILISALWAALGVGLGSLITNQAAALVTVLGYRILGEALITLLLVSASARVAAEYLPGATASNSVLRLALTVGGQDNGIGAIAAGPPWAAGVLVFAGYTALFCLLGYTSLRARDVT
jgi:ABC-type transport system involved in multi-copper enzyme maturation permease subunit